jgi:hypothetical protein
LKAETTGGTETTEMTGIPPVEKLSRRTNPIIILQGDFFMFEALNIGAKWFVAPMYCDSI